MSRFAVTLAVLAMAVMIAPNTGLGEVISPLNGSFEEPAIGAVNFELAAPPDNWFTPATSANSIRHNPGFSGWFPVIDGNAAMGLETDIYGETNSIFGVAQDLGTMVNAGDRYDFSATLGSFVSAVENGYVCAYSIRFENVEDGSVLSEITEADFDPSALGNLQTMLATMSATAGASDVGDTLRLIAEGGRPDEIPVDPFIVRRTSIDAVSVTTTPVPEPSSLLLAAIGLLGLGLIGWRRK